MNFENSLRASGRSTFHFWTGVHPDFGISSTSPFFTFSFGSTPNINRSSYLSSRVDTCFFFFNTQLLYLWNLSKSKKYWSENILKIDNSKPKFYCLPHYRRLFALNFRKSSCWNYLQHFFQKIGLSQFLLQNLKKLWSWN